MSVAHFLWLSTGSTDSPMILTPRLSNSGLSRAMVPSSVVHTGVKSWGCEHSTTQLLPIQSWKRILPSVVSASKSGAVSPICSAMENLRRLGCSDFCECIAILIYGGNWPNTSSNTRNDSIRIKNYSFKRPESLERISQYRHSLRKNVRTGRADHQTLSETSGDAASLPQWRPW